MRDLNIAVLRPPEHLKSLPKRRDAGLYFRIVLGEWMQEHDASHALGLLRARRERPRGHRAAKERDELASPAGELNSVRTVQAMSTVIAHHPIQNLSPRSR